MERFTQISLKEKQIYYKALGPHKKHYKALTKNHRVLDFEEYECNTSYA